MGQKHSSRRRKTRTGPCQVCQKAILHLPENGRSRRINNPAEVREMVKDLVGMPCPRIEAWIRGMETVGTFEIPGYLNLFDILASEVQKGVADNCNFCSNLSFHEAPAHAKSFLAARHRRDGTWEFGYCTISRSTTFEGLANLEFHGSYDGDFGITRQYFLASVAEGRFDAVCWVKKVLMST